MQQASGGHRVLRDGCLKTSVIALQNVSILTERSIGSFPFSLTDFSTGEVLLTGLGVHYDEIG
jgi:hypothetical protein